MGNDTLLIEKLPKVDLHLHLDGSIKPETVIELAQAESISLPFNNKAGLLPYMQINDSCESLSQYLSKFEFVSQFLHSKAALERVAFDVVEQAYVQNCKYIEVRFGPQLHRMKGLTLEEVIDSVIKGLKKGEKAFGVKAQAIACCLRHHSIKDNIDVIEAAANFVGHGLAAVDLAGDEASFPAALHRSVFQLAMKKGIPITIHAGEAAGPENIYEAITHLGASRIGHGVRSRENEEVLNLIQKNKIPLEMCPISNIQTKACCRWEDYPIRDYFDMGIFVTINTDNLTVSKTSLTREYTILKDKFNFTINELCTLIMNGVEAAFLSSKEKAELKNTILMEYTNLGVYSKKIG